jgi:hypothetical protein
MLKQKQKPIFFASFRFLKNIFASLSLQNDNLSEIFFYVLSFVLLPFGALELQESHNFVGNVGRVTTRCGSDSLGSKLDTQQR